MLGWIKDSPSLVDAGSSLRRQVRRLRFHTTEATPLFLLSAFIGLLAGLAAVIFHWMVATIHHVLFQEGQALSVFLGDYYLVLLPTLGGLIAGPLIYLMARGSGGHVVPEIILAVIQQGGRIRPRVAAVTTFASAVTIGSGGSAGQVGPIVQVGASLGSLLGQALHFSRRWLRTLVACGAAGGVAAIFNAPIAGMFFAIEVILGEYNSRALGMVMLSSVTASVVGRIFLGEHPAFQAPAYRLVSPVELIPYAALGLLSALAAVLFIKALTKTEELFGVLPFPQYLKPALGGAVVGLLGITYFEIFGVGFEAIEAALNGRLTLLALLSLVPLKIIATSVTLGSGGSGGLFAPSLFIGAMLGGAFGSFVHSWEPGLTAGAGAYALVAMAAVFAGAAHTPITAVIILFEMTNDYQIILPLMTATAVSTIISQHLSPDSIYSVKLRGLGTNLRVRRLSSMAEGVPVATAMRRHWVSVPPDTPVLELTEAFNSNSLHAILVITEANELHGIITVSDIQRRVVATDAAPQTAADIATTNPITIYPDETIHRALRLFGSQDIGVLPVVDRKNPRHVIGVLERSEAIGAYYRVSQGQLQPRRRGALPEADEWSGPEVVEWEVPPNSKLANRQVRELQLPQDCSLVMIRRYDELIIPHGDTMLRPGDRVVAITTPDGRNALSFYLS